MKSLGTSFKKIFHEERGFLGLMILLFLVGLALFIIEVLRITGGGSLNYVGYGDIGKFTDGEIASLWSSGGYRAGNWIDMMAFPIFAVILCIFHNLLAVRIFERRGKGIAKMFILLSFGILIGTFIVFLRLSGEG